MKRKTFFFLLLLIHICISFSFSQGVRKPVWAGMFYDKNKESLSSQIDRFLENAQIPVIPEGKIMGLISPHAGYIYSGQIAASGYRLVQGKDYETVIVIGPSHRYGFVGCSIYPQGSYETPLGTIEVDNELASEISKASQFKYIPQAHKQEHSIEVQIPFIQKVLPQAKIVPIVMGYPRKQTILALANALAKTVPEKKVLIVASTDLSHHLPRKMANETDHKTISFIQSFNTDDIIKKLERNENIMCGGGPVTATLLCATERAKVQILKYGDSSEAGGSSYQVVGYLSAAIYSEATPLIFSLSQEEKKELIQIARLSIEQYTRQGKVIDYQTQNPDFIVQKGAFVTLKKKGRLRGCIGFIEPYLPLYQTVISAAIYAACKDARFPPVSP